MGKIIVPRFTEKEGFSTTKERSDLMGKIKSIHTKPEKTLRKALWNKGIRYRINSTKLPGKPDIVINKHKIIIFVDGEFWHGYNWEEKKRKIKANRGFWIPKIERNMQRDAENNKALKEMGYTVFRFWEQEIKKGLNGCIKKISETIQLA